MLDLGEIGNVADVKLNRQPIGVAWIRPYRLEGTRQVTKGTNLLEIMVTNTLINYISGLDDLPDVPTDLVPYYGHTAPTYIDGAEAWKNKEKGFQPLPLSGLMGPVKITPRCNVSLDL